MGTGNRALVVVTCLSVLAGGPVASAAAAQRPSGAEKAWQLRINSTARVIAGLPPTHSDHRALAERPEWKTHSAKLRGSWAWLQKRQIAPLTAWRNQAVPGNCPAGTTLLYPFSGPDFFNAYWLFPNCETYVLFGLEPIGTPPAIEKMNEMQLARLLNDVREAMANLLARNYFVTSRMDKQMRGEELNGVVPIVMISMALAGVEILRIAPLRLAPPRGAASREDAGTTTRPRRKLRGISIEFRRPGSPFVQRLNYFSVDASNAGVARYPQFRDHLRRLAPTTTLIKSASYLLHVGEFRKMRDVLLEVSEFLVQDDTGFPYGVLTKHGWQLSVYGRYRVPIPPFERYYQPDLAEAYYVEDPASLPFHFGYRRKFGDDRTHVMVGQRVSLRRVGSGRDAAGEARMPAAAQHSR